MKDINIVFVNYFSKDELAQAVVSLLADIKDSAFQVQITVVDNSGNKDGVKEKLAEISIAINYLDSGGNIGYSRGNNAGFVSCPARYYFALNCDTVIPENSHVIDRIIRFMDNNPRIGCIGPKILGLDNILQYTCYRFNLPSILIKPLKQINFERKYKWVKKYTDQLLMRDFDHDSTRPVDWVLGAALIVRKEATDEVGWFDERYFMYMEDCDWCRRFWEKGWPVYYVHDIIIQHRHARDSAKVPGIMRALWKNKLARIHLVSWLKFLWKWRGNHKYYRLG